MKVERFEDLICWQEAHGLTNAVCDFTQQPESVKDFELVRQIRRAAVSVMSNIAEGFERWTRKEWVRFLDIAKDSAGEVRSQLYVAPDQRYIRPAQFQATKTQAEKASQTIASLIGYLDSHTVTYQVRETASEQLDFPAEFCNRNLGT